MVSLSIFCGFSGSWDLPKLHNTVQQKMLDGLVLFASTIKFSKCFQCGTQSSGARFSQVSKTVLVVDVTLHGCLTFLVRVLISSFVFEQRPGGIGLHISFSPVSDVSRRLLQGTMIPFQATFASSTASGLCSTARSKQRSALTPWTKVRTQ